MICQLCFKEGRLFFRNKYVQTKGYVDEQAAGRPLYKGAFSTGNPAGGWFNNPLDLKFKNVANTHVTQVQLYSYTAHAYLCGLPVGERVCASQYSTTQSSRVDRRVSVQVGCRACLSFHHQLPRGSSKFYVTMVSANNLSNLHM
jgi:hypothetical protein